MARKKISQPLTRFSIKGLYGEKDITIPFPTPYKILVAENGTGKTTVLNLLYLLLSCKFHKLKAFDFKSLSVKFYSGEVASIKREDLDITDQGNFPRFFWDRIQNVMSPVRFRELMMETQKRPISALRRNPDFRMIQEMTRVPILRLAKILRQGAAHWIHQPQLEFDEIEESPLRKVREIIQKNFTKDSLYFPTYRRIEEDLRGLGLEDMDISDSDDNQLIQFGMADVRERVENITSEIKNSSIEWFSKINGQMLTQLIDGIKVSEHMRESIKKPEAIRIVLDRSGENISDQDKRHILEVIKSQKQLGPIHDPLVYFLSNLIKVYDQQRDKDNAIKEFTKVCNNYLVDKEVIYNESNVSIDIMQKKTNNPVSIEKLSSGEKQIISLFSRLYLDKTKDCAIFIDEPELSLSIEWQKQFLPDILNSTRCIFLFATTHSPFIFENDLDKYTSELSQYIKER